MEINKTQIMYKRLTLNILYMQKQLCVWIASIYFYVMKIFVIALEITNHPMNVTVCSGTKAKISCGYTGVSDFFNTRPDWRIIRRHNNGSVISNVTVSGVDIRFNKFDDLTFTVVVNDNRADGSYLSVGPVDDTYNNTSYQCIFTINDNIIESDTAGTITVIGMYASG